MIIIFFSFTVALGVISVFSASFYCSEGRGFYLIILGGTNVSLYPSHHTSLDQVVCLGQI